MDRDNRWDRIEKAYNTISGNAKKEKNFIHAIKESYANKVTDEFFKPINHEGYDGVKPEMGFFITKLQILTG